MLVNPATSFSQSMWPTAGPLLSLLPRTAYQLLPFGVMPLISNPVAMALRGVDTSKPPQEALSDVLYSAVGMLPEIAALRVMLPQDTLQWKLQLLKQGSERVESRLSQVSGGGSTASCMPATFLLYTLCWHFYFTSSRMGKDQCSGLSLNRVSLQYCFVLHSFLMVFATYVM